MGSLWYLLVIIDWIALAGFVVGLILSMSDNDQIEKYAEDLIKCSLWVFGIDSAALLLYAFIIQIIFYVCGATPFS